MRSTSRSAASKIPARAQRVALLCHHLRSVIDVLEQFADEKLPEPMVPSPPATVSSPTEMTCSPPEKLSFTIKEVVVALGIGRSTIYAAIAQGRLKAVKVGRRTLILRDDLHAWMATFSVR